MSRFTYLETGDWVTAGTALGKIKSVVIGLLLGSSGYHDYRVIK